MPNATLPAGVWSATPTPLLGDLRLDLASVGRLVEHHLRLGVRGLFLAGTCGEGAWLPDRDRRALVREVTRCAAGGLAIAVQVTDNSAPRVIDNIHEAAEDGAQVAVIAPPYVPLNPTPTNLLDLYTEAIRHSPLPVGIYDRGRHGTVVVPPEVLAQVYREPNVAMVKDSSSDPAHRELALAARRERPDLLLLDGDEFDCAAYIRAGYDGLLLGGGVFNGYLAGRIIEAVHAGETERAQALQQRMNRLMFDVYGGEQITCWLSGLKKLVVEMGIFSTWRSFLNYPLTADCEAAIARVLREDADVLLPWSVSDCG